MATSQNGWSVITSKDLDTSAFPETKIVPVPGVRKGDVATVLHYVGTKFDSGVEKLVNPGCWGYFNRPIRGSTVTSNHASGTAIDLNAPKHPLGASGTFSATQKAAIRKILNYCDGVVRWGGDYSARKDEMHFEIIGNATQVANLAKKIKGGTVDDMIPRGVKIRLYQDIWHKSPTEAQISGVPDKISDLDKWLADVKASDDWQRLDKRLANYDSLTKALADCKSSGGIKPTVLNKGTYEVI